MELDLGTFARKIFNEEPRAESSITVDFEEAGLEGEDLFKELCMIFAQGMRILYANEEGKVDLHLLNATQFDEVDKYFRSFGYRVIITTNKDGIDGNPNDPVSVHFMTLATPGGKYFVQFSKL